MLQIIRYIVKSRHARTTCSSNVYNPAKGGTDEEEEDLPPSPTRVFIQPKAEMRFFQAQVVLGKSVLWDP